MAIQVLNVRILHRTEKTMQMRMHCHVHQLQKTRVASKTMPFGIIAAVSAGDSTVQEDDLPTKQKRDSELEK